MPPPGIIALMKTYKLFTDGGARGNPGPSGAGALLYEVVSNTETLVAKTYKYLGKGTNNDAEYKALLLGLDLAVTNSAKVLTCYLDSELVVKQLKGEYKVKNARLKQLFDDVVSKKATFDSIFFVHVKRDKNSDADALVNLAIDEALNGTQG